MKRKTTLLTRVICTVLVMCMLLSYLPLNAVFAEDSSTTDIPTLQELYEQWKDVEEDKYTSDSVSVLKQALIQTKDALDGKTGLLKDTANWWVQKPGDGAVKISQSEFAAGGYAYDFPLRFDSSNAEYLNMVMTSHGLYENGSNNWQSRQNYYVLEDAITVDFVNDKLNFKFAVYLGAGKDIWINAPNLTLVFDNLGSVNLISKNNVNYFAEAASGKGRVYSADIDMSELKNYMTDEQKTLLEANGGMANLKQVNLFHDVDSMWVNGDGANAVWGIDIYNFEVCYGDEEYVEMLQSDAYTALQAAVDGLAEKKTPAQLQELYDQWKDIQEEDYPEAIYQSIQAALAQAEEVLQSGGTTELLKNTANWWVYDPNAIGTYISPATFRTNYPDTEFPLTFTETEEYLTMLPAAQGLYDSGWRYRQQSYRLENALLVNFEGDKLDFKFTAFMHYPGKNTWFGYGPTLVMNFETLGAVILSNNTTRNYYVSRTEGAGWLYQADNIPLSDLKNYMTDEQKTTLEANGGVDKLVSISLYHNPDMMWNAGEVFGFDIYEFTIMGTQAPVDSAYAALETAIASADNYDKLDKLYNEWKDEEAGDYSISTYNALQIALSQAKNALDGKMTGEAALLKNTADWQVVDPYSTGSYISQSAYSKDFYGYDFPLVFDESNEEYLNIELTSHGLYEGQNLNWQNRRNYYAIADGVPVDFTSDTLDFKLAFYITGKAPWILPGAVKLQFEELGTVSLTEEGSERYLTGASYGVGRVHSGNISMSELQNYMSEEQKALLATYNNKATLTGVYVYHNSESMWLNGNGAAETWGIDIYKFNVIHSGDPYAACYEVLKTAAEGLKINATYAQLKALYNEWKDLELGNYSITTYTNLQAALEHAENVIDGKTELLKETENWWIVKPGVGTPFAPSEYSASVYGYDFPLIFDESNEEYLNMVMTSHGLYENGASNWQARQNYYVPENAVPIDFANDKLNFKFAVYLGKEKNVWINTPTLTLTFENVGSVNIISKTNANYLEQAVAGKGRVYAANIDMSQIQNYMTDEQKAILIANGGMDKLKQVSLYHDADSMWANADGASAVWGIDIYKFQIEHSEEVYPEAYAMLKEAVDGLVLTNKKFIFDNEGEWYVRKPHANEDTYIPQVDNKDILGVIDRRVQTQAYYQLALLQKGLYELPNEVGTYKMQYVFEQPLQVDFENDAFYLDICATAVGQQNMDEKYYVDLWFEGYDKPVRLSVLYEDNRGKSQGRTQVTANLCEFMDETWEDDGLRAFVEKKGGVLKLTKLDISATYTDKPWYWGGYSILIHDFSLGDADRATASEMTERTKALTASDYATTIADRYTVQRLLTDYKYMEASEKKKLSQSTVSTLDKLKNFLAKAQKSAYMFETEFEDKSNWQSTGAFNEADLSNGLGPITDEKAYLDYRTRNGSMLVYPTGLSIQNSAFMGGACTGWNNLWYTLDTPRRIDLNNTSIYYDVESTVHFAIVLFFNDTEQGVVISEENAGTYTGVIDLAEYVNSLTDDEQMKAGIYGRSTAYVTKIRILQNVNKISDVSIGHRINIRTLALSDSKNAYYNASQYKKASLQSGEGISGVSDVEIVSREDELTYNETMQTLTETGFRAFVEQNMWYLLGLGFLGLLGVAVIILIIVKKKRRADEPKEE